MARKKRKGRRISWSIILILLVLAVAYVFLYSYFPGARKIIDDLESTIPSARQVTQPLKDVALRIERLFPAKRAAPTPKVAVGEWYQVYFSNVYGNDESVGQRDPNNIDKKFIEVLGQAKRSIDAAFFEMDLDTIARAFVDAERRGVRVRFVTDDESLKRDEDKKLFDELKGAGISVVDDGRGALMHNKFAVIDGEKVWTGSYNITKNGSWRNNENAILISSRELAANYEREFEKMFVKREFGASSPLPPSQARVVIGGTEVESYFAPDDGVGDKIIEELRKAKHSIRFMAFSFTHDGIGDVVIDKYKAGVKVQGVFEERGTGTQFSEYNRMKRAGMDVRLDGNPLGILHHKVFIIDDEVVITGSFNFSKSADKDNDENILIIHNKDIARIYGEEFDRIYERGT
ncbi:MAG: phospholipase D-like domain-containing protein [bacterium]